MAHLQNKAGGGLGISMGGDGGSPFKRAATSSQGNEYVFEGDMLGKAKEAVVKVESTVITQRIFMKLRVGEFISLYMGFSGLGIGIIEKEVSQSYGVNEQKEYRLVLLCLNVLTTICLLMSITFNYIITLKWQKSKGMLTKLDDIFNTGYWKPLLLEWVVCLPTPMPWFWNSTWNEHLHFGSTDEITVTH